MQFTTALIALFAGAGMAQFSGFPQCAVSVPFQKHHTYFDYKLLTWKQQGCLENSARLQPELRSYVDPLTLLTCKQPTECAKTNTACLCADQAYQQAAAECIENAANTPTGCDVTQEIDALEVFQQLCSTSGTP